jgi:hypothetical protein
LLNINYSLLYSIWECLQVEPFHSRFIIKTLYTFLFLSPRLLHAPPISPFDHVRNIWWRAQFKRFLKILFPLICYYFRLDSKHLFSIGFCFLYIPIILDGTKFDLRQGFLFPSAGSRWNSCSLCERGEHLMELGAVTHYM